MKSMYMNSDKLRDISNQLNSKIRELSNCYNAVNDRVKELDGSNETWKGEKQKKFYSAYTLLSSNFPTNIDKLNEFHDFLCGVIKEYDERDSTINKDVDVNVDNLDM